MERNVSSQSGKTPRGPPTQRCLGFLARKRNRPRLLRPARRNLPRNQNRPAPRRGDDFTPQSTNTLQITAKAHVDQNRGGATRGPKVTQAVASALVRVEGFGCEYSRGGI